MRTLFQYHKPSWRFLPCVSLLATGLMLTLAQIGIATAGQYSAPDLDGFMLHDERDADGDGDGVNETHIMQYLSQSGDSIASMTTNGRLWAWSLDTRDNESGNKNYVIRDSNCDGIFDEVYGLDDEFHVPGCTR
jgi:hypothetical protein